ncbi:MAG TPA: proprotein convertase P-domain-containing protein [Bacteroidia bacterium]|nr:proprotein convertase P-domain-containing protein [Bacteroidia bacterium]
MRTFIPLRRSLAFLTLLLVMSFTQERGFSQTISNSCSGANQITVGNCTSNQDVNDNTVNDPSGSGCINGLSRDGWFYFVANSTRTGVVWNDNNSSRDAALAVYTGSCGSLTLFACADNNGQGADESLSLTTVVGTTYRIRIGRMSGGSGNLRGSVCVYNLPQVTSFNPTTICTGSQLTITGTSFTGATGVTINGTAATSVTVVNSTTITCTVASGTTSGTVTVTNAGGSGSSASSLTVNATPVGTATPGTQTLCGSGSTSVALSSTVGGTSYSWTVVESNVTGSSDCPSSCGSSIAQSLSNVNGTSTGTSTFTITPATASCTGNTFTATITVRPKPVVSANNLTPTICSGTGPADALSSTVSGTSYAWTVSQSGVSGGSNCSSSCGSSINQTLTASGVVAGIATYTVTPTANSCSGNTLTVTVTVNPKPVATITPSSQSLCSGDATSLSLTSNIAGTTFSWTASQNGASGAGSGSGNSITQSLTNTAAGTMGTVTYTVTPTASGCNGNTATASVKVAPKPTATLASSPAEICEGSSATLTSNASGGIGGVVTGSNNTAFTISTSGTPTVNSTITMPAAYISAASKITLTMNINHTWSGDLIATLISPNNGSAIIFNRPGGTNNDDDLSSAGNYSFATSFAASFPPNVNPITNGNYNATFSGITFPINNAAGTWTLKIEDKANQDGGSLNSWSLTIDQGNYSTVFNGPPSIGAISYSGVANSVATTSVTPSLGSNLYNSIVTDANGCISSPSADVDVTVNPIPVATANPANQTVCSGISIADILFGTSNAVSGTQFSWTRDHVADVSGIAPAGSGDVSGTLTNTTSDPITVTFTITPTGPAPSACIGLPISATVLVNPSPVTITTPNSEILCEGGTSNISLSSATSGTTFSWTANPDADITGAGAGSGNNIQQTLNNSGLATESVVYTITPVANGCTGTDAIATVQVSSVLNATATIVTDVSCNGGADGSASVTGSGGTAPYSVSPSTTGLSAGSHSFTITDANGCTAVSNTIIISEPTALVATCSVVTNVSCNGGSDGSAQIAGSGGTAPYTGEGTISGLAAGTHTLSITDANGCSASCTITITQPDVLSAICSMSTAVSCHGGNDGAATVSASGGTAPYTGTGTFTGLAAGTYTYTVSDANGCSANCSVTITEPAALDVSATLFADESCPGSGDGSITVSASGGTAPYTGTGLMSGYTAGSYSFTVTDANGCSASASATVGTSGIVSSSASSITASSSIICLGSSVTLTVVGGNLGTSADWVWYEGGCGAGAAIATGSTASVVVSTLGNHTYFVRAEGACGVSGCVSITISGINTLPSPIAILSAPASGCVGGTASITCATVPGATSYNWIAPAGVLINGQNSPVISVSTTVTLTFTALPPAGTSGWNICVAGVNPCGTSANTKCHWVRATISTPSPIAGSTIGCPSSSGTYSVNAVDGAAQYVWSVTGNATINGGGATVTTTVPNVTVNFGNAFSSGQICVYAKTSCGYSGANRCLSVAAAPAIPGAINGSSTICPGSASVYSITPVTGAVSYLWSVTGSGISVVGAGTSATVSTTSGFTTGSVCVIAVSACGSPQGNSPQRCKTLGTGKLPTPGNITGDPTTGVCGQTYQYTIPSMVGATSGYSWSLPSGVIALNPPTSNTITLQFPSNFVSGQLCVSGVNGCGNGFSRCINLFGNPGTPASISGNNDVCAGATEVYTWPSVPGATSYQVIVPVGATVLTGTPTVSTMAVILWGTTGGSIGVKANNGCGNSGTRTLPVSMSCRLAQTIAASNTVLDTKVYPNPAHGQFSVQFNSDVQSEYKVKVMDQTGRTVREVVVHASVGNNVQQLNVEDLAAGLYLVVLESDHTGINKYPLLLQ